MAEKKPKTEVVDRETGEGQHAYEILREARDKWCPHLEECNIVLIWLHNVKPTKDGHVKLGDNKPVTEEDRELHGFDRKIRLNRETWNLFDRDQQLALMHHELLHTDKALDKDGEPVVDAHGKLKWRTVKHDMEEFFAVARTHGCYKSDLVAFAEALMEKSPQLGIFDAPGDAAAHGEESAPWHYLRVDGLFGHGEGDWALRFNAVDHRSDSLTGAYALEPREDFEGAIDFGALPYQDDAVTIRRCRAAYEDLLAESATAEEGKR